jgi:ferredoxin
MSATIRIDREKCCSFGACVEIAPDFFDLDPADGFVVGLAGEVGADDGPRLHRAVDACPTGALTLEEVAP